MTKIRTLEELQAILDTDLTWRRKELKTIKDVITVKNSEELVKCYARSGIALIYAHWEGFIKAAGQAYLTYVASQRLTYADLTNNLVSLAAKRLLSEAGLSNKVTICAKVTEFFTSGLADRCTLPIEIETKSNLSSEVLKEITYTLGIDYREYGVNAQVIDEMLLGSRNKVVHGEYLVITVAEFLSLHGAILNLLNLFSNQISNAASMRAYKRTP